MTKYLEPKEEKLKHAFCPFDASDLRVVACEDHPWGEVALLQCDECGAIIDVCTMSQRDVTLHAEMREIAGADSVVVKTVLGMFKTPEVEEKPVRPVKACRGCPGTFTPRANAKSVEQTDFCPDCRGNGRMAEILKEDEKKRKKSAKRGTGRKK
jgi:hypothetical protein